MGLKVDTIQNPSSSTVNLTLDTGGNVTVGNNFVMGSSFLRNRIINGDMRVNQRGYTSAAPLTTAGGYPVDRYQISSVTTGGFSSYQSSTAPTGFTNSLFFTKTTGASPSAGDANYIVQPIEGYNISDLAWGTANAKTITLSFWVYAGATGTFSGSLRNATATLYSYPFTYTISSANTWTQISVTVAGPTVGTWATDSTAGVYVFFDLGGGTNFRGTAGAWSAGNYTGATGATTYPVSTTGGTFYVTGVQLEVGSVATPFERRLYGQELVLCQRYYQQITGSATLGYSTVGTGVVVSATNAFIQIPFAATMRQAPTYSFTGTLIVHSGLAFPSITSLATQYTGTSSSGFIQVACSAGGQTIGSAAIVYTANATANAFAMSSEL